MKRLVLFVSCLLLLVAAAGCGKPQIETRFDPMLRDRAIVVLRNDTTGAILRVDTFAAANLTDTIVYTDGPSVRFVCFGDLVNPDIHHIQISGKKVEMQCQGGMIMSVFGNTLTFDSALSTEFLEQVEQELANNGTKTDQ